MFLQKARHGIYVYCSAELGFDMPGPVLAVRGSSLGGDDAVGPHTAASQANLFVLAQWILLIWDIFFSAFQVTT